MSSVTVGVDIGTSAVKAAVLGFDGEGQRLLAHVRERIHRRDPAAVAAAVFSQALGQAGIDAQAVRYVATTGDADGIDFRDGHFYGMTTHARGAMFLEPSSRAVIDCGALHARVMVLDEKSKVLKSRMTSQCAAGTGQFLENIARYLGVSQTDVGALSQSAPRGEPCSGICAVLSETDVINMVSRGVPVGEILRGVHESIAQRLAKLLRSVGVTDAVTLTGGMAADTGLVSALRRELERAAGAGAVEVRVHPLSAWAGAIGAALWAEVRRTKVEARERGAQPTPLPADLKGAPAV